MKFLSLIYGLSAALLLSAQDFTPSKAGMDSAPEGWKVYGKGPGRLRMEGGTLRITDLSPVNEWGIWRSFPAAGPGKYEVSAEYTGEADGAQLVLIAGKETRVFHLKRIPDGRYVRCVLGVEVPEGVKSVHVHFYSTYQGKADFSIRSFSFGMVEKFTLPNPEKPSPSAPVSGGVLPDGWKIYGHGPGTVKMDNGVIRIADQSNVNEWGVWKAFPVTLPGKYEASAEIGGAPEGAQMVLAAGRQIRVLPFESGADDGGFTRRVLGIEIPGGVKSVMLYIYSTYQGKADFSVRNITFGPVKEFSVPQASRECAPPGPVSKLKNLHLETPLRGIALAPGSSRAAAEAAKTLVARFGGRILRPEEVKFPLEHHVIALGNRTDNDLINRLYLRGFCCTDRVYPGKGGFELRSIHNPSGGGWNVILCGGSEEAGVLEAAAHLAHEGPVAGHLMKIRAPAYAKPFDAYDPERYYLIGAGGYYGWNYLSGMMALFYQTGDLTYAREFLRLAFPDAGAKKDFQKFNPESIELPDDPLAGPYHYCAHQMILFWDLIEEHPFFSDEQRLKITNAFVRQWKHHLPWTRPAGKRLVTSSRHGQWASICLYTLGRYFQRDYPSPVWADALCRAEADFRAASDPDGWIEGERGLIAWFVSGSINPAVNFFTLSGGKAFHPDGAFANAVRFMETQWDGSSQSEILATASRQTFHLAAEHTRDGKFLWYADLLAPYTEKARLGASFLPTGKIAPRPPEELRNTWTTAPMKKGERRFFHLDKPEKNLFLGLSWRDTLDTKGDWISFNCFNEEYRTAYKLLSLYGLRVDGTELLKGLGNYVQIYRGGTTGKEIPTVGEVYDYGSAGNMVFFSGGVEKHSFGAWRRDLLLQRCDSVLIADTIRAADAGTPLSIAINFQSSGTLQPAPAAGKFGFSGGVLLPVRLLHCSGSRAFPISSGVNNTLFETGRTGDRAIIDFPLAEEFHGEIRLHLNAHNTRAESVDIYLDGKKTVSGVRHYTPDHLLIPQNISLGHQTLGTGRHRLEIEVAACSSPAGTSWIGVGRLELRKDGEKFFHATAPGTECVTRTGNAAVLKRTFPSDPAKSVTTFTLIRRESPDQPLRGTLLSEQAVLFEGEEKILAFTGDYAPFGRGALIMIGEKRATGSGVTALGGILNSSRNVAIDWHYGKSLALSGAPGTTGTFEGKGFSIPASGSLTLASARCPVMKWPAPPHLPGTVTKGKTAEAPSAGMFTECARFPEEIRFLAPTREGFLAGAGNHLHELDSSGKVLRTFSLDAPVLCAAKCGHLTVAGTEKEEIAAFSPTGQKIWSFRSRLAPEVEITQKYYWFKSAYPGVMSLAVRDGRIFAGSACTMEVLDAKGKLLGRYAQPWGPCRSIAILVRNDGSYRAVGLRTRAADGVNLWSVDSRTGTNISAFCHNVPGYKAFPAFGSLYRTRQFVGDFDGDGRNELMTDAQGMYCWLNVYDTEGRPLRQINLGPGDGNMGKVVLDWDAGDFTGDARPEAVLATALNQLIAIDGKCVPIWCVDLPFSARHVAVDASRRRIIAADRERIFLFSGTGKRLAEIKADFPCDGVVIRDGQIFFRSGNRLLCAGKDI